MTKNKVTLKEFRKYYQEFISNYLDKYRFLDLDFKSICFMKHGINSKDFDILINQLDSTR
jgi:hypothetical protein